MRNRKDVQPEYTSRLYLFAWFWLCSVWCFAGGVQPSRGRERVSGWLCVSPEWHLNFNFLSIHMWSTSSVRLCRVHPQTQQEQGVRNPNVNAKREYVWCDRVWLPIRNTFCCLDGFGRTNWTDHVNMYGSVIWWLLWHILLDDCYLTMYGGLIGWATF